MPFLLGLGYTVVDTDSNGSELVSVDGSQSHTHATGEVLVKWIWKEGSTVLATTEQAQFVLSTGSHDVSLYVEDSAGNNDLFFTVIEVLEGGFPQINSISPNQGSLGGGTQVTINGSGFTGVQSVKFGSKSVTGVTVVSANQIKVTSPSSSVGGSQVQVSVVTNKGESNSKTFTYQGAVSIDFSVQNLLDFQSPACVRCELVIATCFVLIFTHFCSPTGRWHSDQTKNSMLATTRDRLESLR